VEGKTVFPAGSAALKQALGSGAWLGQHKIERNQGGQGEGKRSQRESH